MEPSLDPANVNRYGRRQVPMKAIPRSRRGHRFKTRQVQSRWSALPVAQCSRSSSHSERFTDPALFTWNCHVVADPRYGEDPVIVSILENKAGWNVATVFTDKSVKLFLLAEQARGPAGIKHPTDLHSHLQRTQGPGWAADRWLCCLGCLLLWLTKFWRGLAQWRGSRSPAGLSGNGSWLWSGSADRPPSHRPPQCPRFDIPCLSTWGCALSVPSGHRLQKAAEKSKEQHPWDQDKA